MFVKSSEWAVCALVSLLLTSVNADVIKKVTCDPSTPGDIYSFSARPLNGSAISNIKFDQYKDQVVLITNVATYNDLAAESYQQLEDLSAKYAGQPFAILGFPNAQFYNEEPEATGTEIYNALKHVRPGKGYEPSFQLFAKSNINGEGQIDLYTYLKSGCFFTDDEFYPGTMYTPLKVTDVRAPFEKFLVDKKGKAYYRYHSSLTKASDLEADIDELLAA